MKLKLQGGLLEDADPNLVKKEVPGLARNFDKQKRASRRDLSLSFETCLHRKFSWSPDERQLLIASFSKGEADVAQAPGMWPVVKKLLAKRKAAEEERPLKLFRSHFS